MSSSKNHQVYVKNFSTHLREKDLEHEFAKYGSIKSISLKSGGYAFIEYDDFRDALAAIEHMDGKNLEGHRLIVEHASKFISFLTLVGKRRERGGERERYRDRDYRGSSRDRYNGGRPYQKRRGPQEEDICYNCGKTGHW